MFKAIEVIGEGELLARRGAVLREIYSEVVAYCSSRESPVTFHDGCGVAYTVTPNQILDVVAKSPYGISRKLFNTSSNLALPSSDSLVESK